MSKFTQSVIVRDLLHEAAQLNVRFTNILYTPEQLLLQAVEFTLYGAQNIRCHPQEPHTHIDIIATLSHRMINIFEFIHRDIYDRIHIIDYRLVYDVIVFTVEVNP